MKYLIDDAPVGVDSWRDSSFLPRTVNSLPLPPTAGATAVVKDAILLQRRITFRSINVWCTISSLVRPFTGKDIVINLSSTAFTYCLDLSQSSLSLCQQKIVNSFIDAVITGLFVKHSVREGLRLISLPLSSAHQFDFFFFFVLPAAEHI